MPGRTDVIDAILRDYCKKCGVRFIPFDPSQANNSVSSLSRSLGRVAGKVVSNGRNTLKRVVRRGGGEDDSRNSVRQPAQALVPGNDEIITAIVKFLEQYPQSVNDLLTHLSQTEKELLKKHVNKNYVENAYAGLKKALIERTNLFAPMLAVLDEFNEAPPGDQLKRLLNEVAAVDGAQYFCNLASYYHFIKRSVPEDLMPPWEDNWRNIAHEIVDSRLHGGGVLWECLNTQDYDAFVQLCQPLKQLNYPLGNILTALLTAQHDAPADNRIAQNNLEDSLVVVDVAPAIKVDAMTFAHLVRLYDWVVACYPGEDKVAWQEAFKNKKARDCIEQALFEKLQDKDADAFDRYEIDFFQAFTTYCREEDREAILKEVFQRLIDNNVLIFDISQRLCFFLERTFPEKMANQKAWRASFSNILIAKGQNIDDKNSTNALSVLLFNVTNQLTGKEHDDLTFEALFPEAVNDKKNDACFFSVLLETVSGFIHVASEPDYRLINEDSDAAVLDRQLKDLETYLHVEADAGYLHVANWRETLLRIYKQLSNSPDLQALPEDGVVVGSIKKIGQFFLQQPNLDNKNARLRDVLDDHAKQIEHALNVERVDAIITAYEQYVQGKWGGCCCFAWLKPKQDSTRAEMLTALKELKNKNITNQALLGLIVSQAKEIVQRSLWGFWKEKGSKYYQLLRGVYEAMPADERNNSIFPDRHNTPQAPSKRREEKNGYVVDEGDMRRADEHEKALQARQQRAEVRNGGNKK